MAICGITLLYFALLRRWFWHHPRFYHDLFGSENYAMLYGAILTAWSVAGIIGPQMVALFKDTFPEKAAYLTFISGACIVGTGLLLSLLIKNQSYRPQG